VVHRNIKIIICIQKEQTHPVLITDCGPFLAEKYIVSWDVLPERSVPRRGSGPVIASHRSGGVFGLLDHSGPFSTSVHCYEFDVSIKEDDWH
jgi:hypothetical protein